MARFWETTQANSMSYSSSSSSAVLRLFPTAFFATAAGGARGRERGRGRRVVCLTSCFRLQERCDGAGGRRRALGEVVRVLVRGVCNDEPFDAGAAAATRVLAVLRQALAADDEAAEDEDECYEKDGQAARERIERRKTQQTLEKRVDELQHAVADAEEAVDLLEFGTEPMPPYKPPKIKPPQKKKKKKKKSKAVSYTHLRDLETLR